MDTRSDPVMKHITCLNSVDTFRNIVYNQSILKILELLAILKGEKTDGTKF